jgi:predicted lipoprotein
LKQLKYISVFALLAVALYGCKPEKKDSYNQEAMLNNLATNVIVPAHQQFNTAAQALKQKSDAFSNAPSTQSLDDLKAAFVTAYTAYMAVETYDFNPSTGVRNLNVFATDTAQINSNIANGNYNLEAALNIRAKGFPAIDYLLYSQDAGTTLNTFLVNNAANRKQYLTDIVNDISTVASNAATAWADYKSQFATATGTDIGSSVGMLVNDVAFSAERCRRERVGNSLGYVGFISSGSIYPYSLEAYYSAESKALLIANLQQLKALYEGGTGEGFDDYLANINAQYDGQPLNTAISTQFDVAIAKANAVPVDFATALNSNKPTMEELFLELKKLTVMLKVDMSSQLGVVINYSDNDGD